MDNDYKKSCPACQNYCHLCVFILGIIFWTQCKNRETFCLLCLEALDVDCCALLCCDPTPGKYRVGGFLHR